MIQTPNQPNNKIRREPNPWKVLQLDREPQPILDSETHHALETCNHPANCDDGDTLDVRE
jgi:hypothetical protein